MTSTYEDILYDIENGIATITINRPEKYNAFRAQTCEELIDAFQRAGWNRSVGVIVLTGAGDRAFCTGGDQSAHAGHYDGRGVIVMRDQKDMEQGFDGPSVLEKLVAIDKELAIIVAIGAGREESIYPPVEMVFDPILNLLDYQLCPAVLPDKVLWKAEAIALTVARNFDSPGLFAVELFSDRAGNVYVNETAPRVHNSGHHTIEAHYCSQYDMLLRILLGMPPGNTDMILPSLMLNLLGESGHSGEARYDGLADVMRIDNAFVHLYGKRETRPGRKMGHVTVMSREKQELLHQASVVKRTLKVRAKDA